MSYQLRDYQKNAVEAGLDFFENGNKSDIPVIVAPTAAGKSIYVAFMAKQLSEPILVLQPSKELFEQNYSKYKAYGGVASIYSASVGQKEIGHVTFATIGSIKSIAKHFAHVKYVIIDECHLVPPSSSSMYMQFFAGLDNVKVIGLTATPFRMKKYNDPFTGEPFSKINLLPRERPRFFNRFLYVTQISELYEKGYLSPIKYIPMAWSDGDLKVNSTGAEYTEESMDFAVQNQGVLEKIPLLVKQSIEKGRKHRLVFVKNVADAIRLSNSIPNSACVHSGTKKKDREKILNDFKSGNIKTVFNVGVLTVGFDFPALDTIIIARPTMSLALYMQIIGRGLRLCDGKSDCAVVDMCGTYDRFGKIEDIEYTTDIRGLWVIKSGHKILSGVRLDEIN